MFPFLEHCKSSKETRGSYSFSEGLIHVLLEFGPNLGIFAYSFLSYLRLLLERSRGRASFDDLR